MRVLHCNGISLLFFEIYKAVFNVQNIWLSLNKGQPFIVPFRQTFIVSSRPYSQMVSRGSRKFGLWIFHPGTGIEPWTFVLVVRCTNHYTTALIDSRLSKGSKMSASIRKFEVSPAEQAPSVIRLHTQSKYHNR